MPCYSPLQAYKCFSGEVVFSPAKTRGDYYELQLPCGQCIGCRLERSRQWAMRCVHESQLHTENTFLTLTYDDEHLPYRGMLNKVDYQRFLKRLRKRTGKAIRYYMCGEYGSETWRPHYHICVFGHRYEDATYWAKSPSGEKLYRSDELEKTWTFGNALIGELTFESAAYTARYCTTKRTGSEAEAYYRRVDKDGEYQLPPEFNEMSRRPGIGTEWYRKYKRDVYPHDYVVINGRESKPPKFYDELYAKEFPDEHDNLKEERKLMAYKRRDDNTPERLQAKQTVTQAQLNMLQRAKL